MSNINGVGQSAALNHVYTRPAAKPVGDAPQTTRPSDRVEIGDVKAAMLSKLHANDIRADKVQDIRAQIEAGTYETDDKLNGAIDKLMDDLD